MKQYLDILRNVLDNGIEKVPTRCVDGKHVPVDGGVKTIALPNVIFSHNMQEGFPLLTTKKMAYKSMAVELEGFIKGITDKSWYQERKCKIWDEWCNPEAEVVNGVPVRLWPSSMWTNWNCGPDDDPKEMNRAEHKRVKRETKDLGPIYGAQWRHFDEHYGDPDDPSDFYTGVMPNTGYDQLKYIVDTLHKSPYDRRMVCSAWNPNQMYMMALPPCHWGFNVSVMGDELNLCWIQRSCDLLLGVPFNIASYALLQTLLCVESGFKAGNLTGVLVDCHLYENQVSAACDQLAREPHDLPTAVISWPDDRDFDIFQWEAKDFSLTNYTSHGKLEKVDVVV